MYVKDYLYILKFEFWCLAVTEIGDGMTVTYILQVQGFDVASCVYLCVVNSHLIYLHP